MGKETKIGLAVIGVLASVLGGLLFRRLTASDVATMPPNAILAPPSSAGMAPKPNIVAAQPNPARDTAGSPEALAPAESEAPRASFMPAERPAAAQDRYPSEREAAPEQEPVAEEPAPSNPFQRPTPAADPVEEQASEAPRALDDTQLQAAPLESQARKNSNPQSDRARKNPLRRVSGQTPVLEEPVEQSSEAPAEIATEEAPPAETTFPADPAEAAPAESGPAQPEIEQAPAETPAAIDANAPLEDNYPRRAPARDEDPAQPAPARVRPPARTAPSTQGRWQAGDDPQSVAPVAAALPDNGKYVVQPNDTLWSIAEKVYGSGRYFKALAEHNRPTLRNTDRLTVGTEIAVPPIPQLEQSYPSLVPKQRKSVMVKPRTVQASARGRAPTGGNTYLVEEGDTLFDIARHELGKASRWAEIYDLNREALGEDFDYLQPGTELAMPAKSPAGESFTRQPDRYQR